MSSFGEGIRFTNVSSVALVTRISKRLSAVNNTVIRMEGVRLR